MRDRLRAASLVLATIGVGIGGYLTYVHYAGLKVLCLSSGGCETVQSSQWAELGGVPVATLGLVGYVLIVGSLLARGELARLATVALTFGGWVFSGYLTYREVFSIHAICQWCVASAIIMTLLFALSLWSFLRLGPELPPLPADLDGGEPQPRRRRAGVTA